MCSENHTKIVKEDDNTYDIVKVSNNTAMVSIKFQNGATQETEINGILMEDLLHIVKDRLEGFNQGDWRCKENSMAITKIEEALLWLNKRTNDRRESGKYGTSEV